MSEPLRIAFDTNILVYAGGHNGSEQQDKALRAMQSLSRHHLLLPAQAAGELYHVIFRRFGVPRLLARATVEAWRKRLRFHAADEATFAAALDLAASHTLQFWDALILATAADAGCRLLLSEDLADGFVFRGCTVADPFRRTLHPLLADALARG